MSARSRRSPVLSLVLFFLFALLGVDSARAVGPPVAHPIAVIDIPDVVHLPGEPVLFCGHRSVAPGSSIARWDWLFLDGQTFSGECVERSFAYGPGQWVRLTVTDARGATDAMETKFDIWETLNRRPIAEVIASPATTGPAPLWVGFNGRTSSDPDGTIEHWIWDLGDGTYRTDPDFIVTFPQAGIYPVSLTVVDDRGAATRAPCPITVLPGLPHAEFTYSPRTGNAPLDVSFDASPSSDAEGIVGYLWDFGDGSPPASGRTVAHRFARRGDYLVRLGVSDADGNTDVVGHTVDVDPSPPVIVLQAGPTTGKTPLAVLFSAVGTHDPDGSIATYNWRFGDGASALGAGAVIGHTYENPGSYEASLEVFDDEGLRDVELVDILVLPRYAPVPWFQAYPESGFAPLDVLLDASASSDRDGRIVDFAWQFGDGTPGVSGAERVSVSHRYDHPGVYTVTLAVRDDDGQTAATTRTVEVLRRNQDPVARGRAEPTEAVWPHLFTFLDDGSYDPDTADDGIAAYRWIPDEPGYVIEHGLSAQYNFAAPGVHCVTLEVTDRFGGVGKDGVCVTATEPPPPPNQPPTIVATVEPLRGAAPHTVHLMSSRSFDPDQGDSIALSRWEFGDGTFLAQADTDHIYSLAGTYLVTLILVDTHDLASTRTWTVTVDPEGGGNQAPVVDRVEVSPEPAVVSQPVTLTAAAHDPDAGDSVVAYAWTIDGEPQSATTSVVTHTFSTAGQKMVAVRARDEHGAWSPWFERPVVVEASENRAPVVDRVEVSAEPAVVSQPVTLTAAAHDPDAGDSIVAYAWTIDGVPQSATTSVVTHTFSTAGQKTVSVRAQDDHGAWSAWFERPVEVEASENRSPVVDRVEVSPEPAMVSQPVTLTAAAHDPDVGDSIVAYAWTIDGVPQSATTSALPHTFSAAGQKTIAVRAQDEHGAWSPWFERPLVVEADVVNHPPVLLSLTSAPLVGPAPLEVVLVADAIDQDGDVLTYSWRVNGRSLTGSEAEVATTFELAGSYLVAVEVRDGRGGKASGGVTVQVAAGAPDTGNHPPILRGLAASHLAGPVPLYTLLTADAVDLDGDALQFAWSLDGVLQGASGPLVAQSFGVAGTYVVGVEVTDGRGGRAVGALTIQASSSDEGGRDNRPPVLETVKASPLSGPAPLVVTLSAVASDPDGDPLDYAWSIEGEPADSSGAEVQTIFTAAGTYVVAVQVADGRGGVAMGAVTIQVEDGGGGDNRPPLLSSLTATPLSGVAPLAVALSAVASDPDGDPLRFAWTLDGRAQPWSGPDVATTFSAGTHVVSIEVRDDRGGRAAGSVTVQVADAGTGNRPPRLDSFKIGRLTDRVPFTTAAEVTASDPDGDPLEISWSIDGILQAATGPVISMSFGVAGGHLVGVEVRDGRGGVATGSLIVEAKGADGTRATRRASASAREESVARRFD